MSKDYAVVIPSANARNLSVCVDALVRVGGLDTKQIFVVDDGARSQSSGNVSNVTWITGIKPFVYARNVNLGIEAGGERDVVLMGDDTILVTSNGLNHLAECSQSRSRAAVISAVVDGVVGNSIQLASKMHKEVTREFDSLAFICVYMPRRAINSIGPLDERFVGYGGEDVDYCRRARAMGWELIVDPGCTVEHGSLLSSFRSRPDISDLESKSVAILRAKWGGW